MQGFKKPSNVKRAIDNVLNGRWDKYISRLHDKVILLLTHVLFVYSILCVSKCESMQCRNVYL